MTAIEEMAGMDVLCSDKTGTLTLNRLTVDRNLIEVQKAYFYFQGATSISSTSQEYNAPIILTCWSDTSSVLDLSVSNIEHNRAFICFIYLDKPNKRTFIFCRFSTKIWTKIWLSCLQPEHPDWRIRMLLMQP